MKNIIYPDENFYISNVKNKSYEESMMELVKFIVNLLELEEPTNIDFETNGLRGFSFDSNNNEYYVRTSSIIEDDQGGLYIDYYVSYD